MAFYDLLKSASFVDFRFSDALGTWHHITFPSSEISESFIQDGIPFDGSSIPGWKAIHESDMLLVPDIQTAVMDHFTSHPTLIVFCDVYDPLTNTPYTRDPRSIGKKAEAYLKATGIGDKAYFGPEAEFFIFDNVQFDSGSYANFAYLFSDELPGASGSEPNHGYRSAPKGGYMPCGPQDSLMDMRSEMLEAMTAMGLHTEKHHHEVATAQHELGFRFNTLTHTADALQIYKYAVKMVAHQYGKTATFMPKPIYGDNGSGMHVHQSLWHGDKPVFAGSQYVDLSETALFYIGGILKHAKALNAFTNPTTNSYKRLVPGFEAPVIRAYSARNRSASCRIPTSFGPKTKRVEVRFPDAMASGYLAFAAMLMAGLDGIQNKIHPGDPADHDLFHNHDAAQKYPTVCGSLRDALHALEEDHAFLLKGDVFTKEFLDAYAELKWTEVHAFEHTPHPVEFKMYYRG